MMAQRGGRPLLLIDLAVPRDIDASCAELRGVTLLDIDGAAEAGHAPPHGPPRRGRAAPRGSSRRRSRRFAGWLGSLEVTPTLRALRARARRGRRRGCWPRTRAAGRRCPSATASASRSSRARRSTGCCTSRRVRLKAADADQRHARLQLLRELFGLEEPGAAADEPARTAEVRALRPR